MATAKLHVEVHMLCPHTFSAVAMLVNGASSLHVIESCDQCATTVLSSVQV